MPSPGKDKVLMRIVAVKSFTLGRSKCTLSLMWHCSAVSCDPLWPFSSLPLATAFCLIGLHISLFLELFGSVGWKTLISGEDLI